MISGVCGILMALFGWSYNTLAKRVDKLALDVQARKTDADIRILINDKLEPFKIQLETLSKQLGMMERQYNDLDHKIDMILGFVKTPK